MTNRPGSFHLDVYDANGETLYLGTFQADRFGTVFDAATGNFTGDTAVTFALTAFWLAVAAFILILGCRFFKDGSAAEPHQTGSDPSAADRPLFYCSFHAAAGVRARKA